MFLCSSENVPNKQWSFQFVQGNKSWEVKLAISFFYDALIIHVIALKYFPDMYLSLNAGNSDFLHVDNIPLVGFVFNVETKFVPAESAKWIVSCIYQSVTWEGAFWMPSIAKRW